MPFLSGWIWCLACGFLSAQDLSPSGWRLWPDTNANIDTNAGLITWRPGVQAGTTNLFTVQVADNGSPILSANQG